MTEPTTPAAPPPSPYDGPGPTAKQRRAWELRRQGLSWQAVADAMGCRVGTARNHVERAEDRGLEPLPKRMRNGNLQLDARSAKAISEAVGPEGIDLGKVGETMEAAGMPRAMISGLLRRLKTQYRPVVALLEKFNADLFAEKLGKKADLILEYMDEPLAASSSMKDLAYALSVIIDRRQLLAGKPTQIYDFTVRAKLEVLLPALIVEARRRGITYEAGAAGIAARDATSAAEPVALPAPSEAATP